MYETPTITELGSVADFTRAAGAGPGTDGVFPWNFIEGVSGIDVSGRTS